MGCMFLIWQGKGYRNIFYADEIQCKERFADWNQL